MEQFYYYWSMWFLWVLTTFIFEKTKRRIAVSVFILTNIILSIHDIALYFSLNAAYLMFSFADVSMPGIWECIVFVTSWSI